MNRQQKRAYNRAKRDARYQDTKAMSMDERICMKLVRDKSIDIAVHDMTQINVMLMFTAAAEVFGAGSKRLTRLQEAFERDVREYTRISRKDGATYAQAVLERKCSEIFGADFHLDLLKEVKFVE